MNWRAAFGEQALACRALGSPFTARLLEGLALHNLPDGKVRDRIECWVGDIGPNGASVPLRLAGALHALALDGSDPVLQAAYPPAMAEDDALIFAARKALQSNEQRVLRWLEVAPQTNEVARSAVLIATTHHLAARFGLPFVLSELGASAGLNLNFDRYQLQAGLLRLGPASTDLCLTPDWRGHPPTSSTVLVDSRAGVDLYPRDPVADSLRLRAYTWADQADRLTRLQKALAIAAECRPPVVSGDAVDWLETRLNQHFPGRIHLIFHTVAWQYFPKAARERGEALLAAAGARATARSPLARLAMEEDGNRPGAGLRLTIYPAGETINLGRADFHGRWIDWQPREDAG